VLFPEALFLLSARDQQVTWLDPVLLDVEQTGLLVASVDQLLLTVPPDRALLLYNIALRSAPGAAQFVTDSLITVSPSTTGVAVRVVGDTTDYAANVVSFLNWQGTMLIPPTWRIFANMRWNAGAAANSWRVGLHGLLIPAGNIQRL